MAKLDALDLDVSDGLLRRAGETDQFAKVRRLHDGGLEVHARRRVYVGARPAVEGTTRRGCRAPRMMFSIIALSALIHPPARFCCQPPWGCPGLYRPTPVTRKWTLPQPLTCSAWT